MSNFYGVRTAELPTGTSPASAVSAESGIVFAVGTAPVHQVGGAANEIVLARSYDEAVSALGYSDDWEKYTLCEVIYSHFKLFGVGPLLLVNVLDPSTKKTSVPAENMNLTNGQVVISGDAIADSIQVKNASATLVAGTDYDVFYHDGDCIIEALKGGAMESLTAVSVSYNKVSDFTLSAMADDVIGGYNVSTGVATGLELVDHAFFKTGACPDILIAPGFSSIEKVAAAMVAKTTYSTVFKAIAVCDLPADSNVANYQAAVAKKNTGTAFGNPGQVVCWPMCALGDKMFHMSTQVAGAMCAMDAKNSNVPSHVSSNSVISADSTILEDGTSVLLDLTAANYLRGAGVVTGLNFVNGFTAWGAYTAAVGSANVDPKDKFINVCRMFAYVSNHIVREYWRRIDEKMTARYAESIADELNVWLNSLVSSGDLLGARCEVRSEENPAANLLAGIVKVHVYMTPPSPAQEIDYVLEYDVDYVASMLGA